MTHSMVRHKLSIVLFGFLLSLIISPLYSVQTWGAEKTTSQEDKVVSPLDLTYVKL